LYYSSPCAIIGNDDKIVRSQFVTKFEQLRTNAGLTITQLSIEAEISRATIEKIEKDQPVRAALAARACNALSKHLDQPVSYLDLGIKTVR
jgi:DNA-binding XRE family transcriptional regulator